MLCRWFGAAVLDPDFPASNTNSITYKLCEPESCLISLCFDLLMCKVGIIAHIFWALSVFQGTKLQHTTMLHWKNHFKSQTIDILPLEKLETAGCEISTQNIHHIYYHGKKLETCSMYNNKKYG